MFSSLAWVDYNYEKFKDTFNQEMEQMKQDG